MPFVPITDTVKVEINGHDSVSNQPVANVLHATLANASQTITNLADIGDAVITAVNANLGCWSQGMVFDNVTVTGLTSSTAPQSVRTFSPGTTGSTTGNSAPGVCALVTVQTALRSRSGRGRVYIGPITVSELTDKGGNLQSSYQTVVNNFFNDLLSGLGGLTIPSTLCIASKVLGVSNPWLSFGCEVLTAYQRRRGMR